MSQPISDRVRQRKLWWVVDDDRVSQRYGYDCGLEHPTVWWMPSLGASMSEGVHLFEAEAEALDKAIAAAKEKSYRLGIKLDELVVRRRHL